jgi:hypothetical protein
MFVRVNEPSPEAVIQHPATGVQVGRPERWLTDPSLHLPKTEVLIVDDGVQTRELLSRSDGEHDNPNT